MYEVLEHWNKYQKKKKEQSRVNPNQLKLEL